MEPPYLAGLLQLYTPSRSLRSSADSRIFRIQIGRKRFQGQCAFFILALSSVDSHFRVQSRLTRSFSVLLLVSVLVQIMFLVRFSSSLIKSV